MTKIIIDTNIAFSVMLNINSRISQIIINGFRFYKFYAPEYIRYELLEHQNKLKEIAHLSDNSFLETYELIIRNLTILNHSILPKESYKTAIELCKSIDIDDTVFVAFTLFMNGKLWTGDKKLLKGLSDKSFEHIVTTDDLYEDFLKKNRRKK